MNKIIGIDPGTTDGAFVVLDADEGQIIEKGILPNGELLNWLRRQEKPTKVFIEKLMCYGMPVGAETFETAYWIGRALEICSQRSLEVTLFTRLEVKVHHCHSAKAKDANVRQALIDRLGTVGTAKNKGPLYGIATHLWSALAIAIYANDTLHKMPP
jgi:Holliday junction resolvasome RuvABC endonuclease subunit